MNRKFGSMKYPYYVDSLSALYIVYKAFDLPEFVYWKKIYYFLLFFSNGIFSSLAHSPLIAKRFPKFNYLMDKLDLYSIIVPLNSFPILIDNMGNLNKLFIILLNLFVSKVLIKKKFFEDWIKHLKITQNYKKKNNAN